MWTITNISANNINSFQKLEYDIQQGVATVIFGENRDNEGQERNGSGKSSLLEAIAFALTGEPLRDVKSAEEIINDMAEEATVSLELVSENSQHIFVVERTIARKSAQIIHTFLDDKEVVLPTVLDYNKYVLEVIGLSKDDLYNNFILCRNRYKSFFKASDREKKEIINRFSNGIMVDQAIAKLDEDINSANVVKTDAELTLSRVKGAIEALESEISAAHEHADDIKKDKENQLNNIKLKIAEKRKYIRSCEESIKEENDKKVNLVQLQSYSDTLEQSGECIEQCYSELASKFVELNLISLKDWREVLDKQKNKKYQLSEQIELLQHTQAKNQERVDKAKADFHKITTKYNELKEQHDKQVEIDKVLAAKIKEQDAENNKKLNEMDDDLNKKDKMLADLKKELEGIEIKLAGKITCPKCHHEFLLGSKSLEDYKADKEKNLANQKDLCIEIDAETETYNKACQVSEDNNQKLEKMRNEYRNRQVEIDAVYTGLSKQNKLLDEYIVEQNKIKHNIDDIQADIAAIEKSIANIRQDLFDEANTIIDNNLLAIERSISAFKNNIESATASITAFQESIKTIESATEDNGIVSLKKSLEKHQRGLQEAEKELNFATDEYNKLAEQKTHFSEFKTYLANQKIAAIAKITNDFLEQIGSDIRVELEGFTLLKSGKIRDKISVNLTRNGENCGSFGKLSGGEQARVCLANILAMHRLTNLNCEDDKGLDILIIDEILDASDESGIASYCKSLNDLKVTALIVTQGYVAENYPYQLKVIKQNGISSI